MPRVQLLNSEAGEAKRLIEQLRASSVVLMFPVSEPLVEHATGIPFATWYEQDQCDDQASQSPKFRVDDLPSEAIFGGCFALCFSGRPGGKALGFPTASAIIRA